MTINRIWIPSLQKFIKMKEMSCEDRRFILKSIDDDADFDLALHNFLERNILEPDFKIEEINIIDKFVSILQSRVHACGDKLKLNRICEKCDTKTDFVIDLNNLLDNMSVLDKPFEKILDSGTYTHPSYSITMDFPSANEYLWAGKDSERTITSCIKNLRSGNDTRLLMNMKNMDYDKKHEVCGKLPWFLWNKAGTYVNSLRNVVNKIRIADLVCSNDKCKDETSLNMDLDNLLDLAKIIFKDSSIQSVLGQYTNVSMNCHFDYNFYKNLSPLELDIISNMLKGDSGSESPPIQKSENGELDLFEQYRYQTAGMVESPSEFR